MQRKPEVAQVGQCFFACAKEAMRCRPDHVFAEAESCALRPRALVDQNANFPGQRLIGGRQIAPVVGSKNGNGNDLSGLCDLWALCARLGNGYTRRHRAGCAKRCRKPYQNSTPYPGSQHSLIPRKVGYIRPTLRTLKTAEMRL